MPDDEADVRTMVYPRLGKPYLLMGVRVIVCHCGVVNDRAVVDALKSGAQTLGGVCRATGAGQSCGACVFSLRRLLCEHEPTVASLPEVEVAAC